MIERSKLTKLIDRLKRLVAALESQKDLVIHQKVDQIYYVQKIAEIKFLIERSGEPQSEIDKVRELTNEIYSEASRNWRRDIRWLNTYILKRKSVKPIL